MFAKDSVDRQVVLQTRCNSVESTTASCSNSQFTPPKANATKLSGRVASGSVNWVLILCFRVDAECSCLHESVQCKSIGKHAIQVQTVPRTRERSDEIWRILGHTPGADRAAAFTTILHANLTAALWALNVDCSRSVRWYLEIPVTLPLNLKTCWQHVNSAELTPVLWTRVFQWSVYSKREFSRRSEVGN